MRRLPKEQIMEKVIKKLVKLAVSTSMLVSPLTAYSKVTKAAKVPARPSVVTSKETADSIANSLVERQFSEAFLEASHSLDNVDQFRMKFVTLLEAQKGLVQSLQSFSAQDSNSLKRFTDEMKSLREQYEDIGSLRYKLSWMPLDMADKLRLSGPLLQNIVNQLKARCDTGRAVAASSLETQRQIMPPAYDLDVRLNTNGDYPTVSFKGFDSSSKNESRLQVAVVNPAVFEAVTYGTPTVAGAFVTAYGVQQFENHPNEASSKSENSKFQNLKRDDYIAEKYVTSCKARADALQTVTDLISMLEENGEAAKQRIALESDRVEEMTVRQLQVNGAAGARCRLALQEAALKNICVPANGDLASKQNAFCQIDTRRGVDLIAKSESCHVGLDASNQYATQEADQREAQGISAEETRDLMIHKIVMAMGPNRDEFLSNVSNKNWETIDQTFENSFGKLAQFISLTRRLSADGISKAEGAPSISISNARTFDALRNRFVELARRAISVVFSGTPRASFANDFSVFAKDFNEFFNSNHLNRDAQNLDQSLRALSRIVGDNPSVE